MILSIRKISPIKDGTYKAKILDIKEFDNVITKYGITKKLLYEFSVFTDEGIVKVKTNVFVNNHPDSQFIQFKKSVLKLFDTKTLDTEDHIGLTVKVKFFIRTTQNGDEYLQLAWYAPYNQKTENVKNNGGNKNEKC